mgnify:CR=1 FL=1
MPRSSDRCRSGAVAPLRVPRWSRPDAGALLYVPRFPLPKIEKREDEYPHQIDEVPIQPHRFDDLVVPLPTRQKPGRLAIQVSPPDLDGHDDQEYHADRHVRAVESRDHEKGSAELRREIATLDRAGFDPKVTAPLIASMSAYEGMPRAVVGTKVGALSKSQLTAFIDSNL